MWEALSVEFRKAKHVRGWPPLAGEPVAGSSRCAPPRRPHPMNFWRCGCREAGRRKLGQHMWGQMKAGAPAGSALSKVEHTCSVLHRARVSAIPQLRGLGTWRQRERETAHCREAASWGHCGRNTTSVSGVSSVNRGVLNLGKIRSIQNTTEICLNDWWFSKYCLNFILISASSFF